MLKQSGIFILLIALCAPACALRITGSGLESVAGSAIAGDDCTTTEGETVQCESMVWSEGFSEGFLGVVGDAVKGLLAFFIPGVGNAEPTTVVVQVERESGATE